MIPNGGITALLCLIIIVTSKLVILSSRFFTFKWILRLKSKIILFAITDNLLPFFIILVISILVVASAFKIVYYGLSNHSNVGYYYEYAGSKVCETPLQDVGETTRMVVLRLDDVQAFSLSGVAIQMIQDAIDRGHPVVAGVIPRGINKDTKLKHFLMKNKCNIQIVMHGYTHAESEYNSRIGEFAAVGEVEAIALIRDANKELAGITGDEIKTFIPPQNMLSIGGQNALKMEGFNVISSMGSGEYDLDTGTWNFDTNAFIPSEVVVDNCLHRFAEGDDLCVIMLHPQDFSNNDASLNKERYMEYIKLIDNLHKIDARIVTFDEYLKLEMR